MKRILKRYTSLRNFLAYLRRQPTHMQHIYAVIFAGTITTLIAAIILYVDYGFWHEKYTKKVVETVESTSTAVTPESPTEMFVRFIGEAKEQLKNINASGSDLLEGKETYIKDVN